jgi:hypothetical protein
MVTVKTIGKLEKDIEKLKIKVTEYISQKQQLLNNENCRDYPNDERVDKYEDQIDILRGVLDHLEECCDELNDYE